MSDTEMDRRQERLVKAAKSLGEWFDSVQIVTTVVEEADTYSFYAGSGNHHARVGSCREFVAKASWQPPKD